MKEPDLFGAGKQYKRLAYRAAPGSGPAGETCGTCAYVQRRGAWSKCGLRSGSSSNNTDISLKSPACSFWRRESEQ